jgi:hypothetical protein
MQGRYGGEAFLDQPVDLRIREMPAQIAGDRKVVHHVAQGRGFDEKDAPGWLQSRRYAYNSDHLPIIRCLLSQTCPNAYRSLLS